MRVAMNELLRRSGERGRPSRHWAVHSLLEPLFPVCDGDVDSTQFVTALLQECGSSQALAASTLAGTIWKMAEGVEELEDMLDSVHFEGLTEELEDMLDIYRLWSVCAVIRREVPDDFENRTMLLKLVSHVETQARYTAPESRGRVWMALGEGLGEVLAGVECDWAKRIEEAITMKPSAAARRL